MADHRSAGPLTPQLTTTHGALFQEDCLRVLDAVRSESIAAASDASEIT